MWETRLSYDAGPPLSPTGHGSAGNAKFNCRAESGDALHRFNGGKRRCGNRTERGCWPSGPAGDHLRHPAGAERLRRLPVHPRNRRGIHHGSRGNRHGSHCNHDSRGNDDDACGGADRRSGSSYGSRGRHRMRGSRHRNSSRRRSHNRGRRPLRCHHPAGQCQLPRKKSRHPKSMHDSS